MSCKKGKLVAVSDLTQKMLASLPQHNFPGENSHAAERAVSVYCRRSPQWAPLASLYQVVLAMESSRPAKLYLGSLKLLLSLLTLEHIPGAACLERGSSKNSRGGVNTEL